MALLMTEPAERSLFWGAWPSSGSICVPIPKAEAVPTPCLIFSGVKNVPHIFLCHLMGEMFLFMTRKLKRK
jgi:hypothetical protein